LRQSAEENETIIQWWYLILAVFMKTNLSKADSQLSPAIF
jgi:hypothetical protein